MLNTKRNYVGIWQQPKPPKKRVSKFAPTPPPEPIADPGAEQPTNFTGSDTPLPEPTAPEPAAETPAQVTTPQVPEPIVETPPAPSVEITEMGPGYVSGRLTVISEAEPDSHSNKFYLCLCSCSVGQDPRPQVRVRRDHLRNKTTVSCGCHRTDRLWFGTKERAAARKQGLINQQRLGGKISETKAKPVSVADNGDNPSPPGGSKNPIIVGASTNDSYSPETCPHGWPISPPVEGLPYGICVECWRCQGIPDLRSLVREWERVLNVKLETRSSRMEREGGGVTGEHLVTVGTGVELERVAETDRTAEEWMDSDDGGDGTGPRTRRKPARKTSPPGTPPDVDFVEDE